MPSAAAFRRLLALAVLSTSLALSGCVTDPNTGEQHFNPWKSLQNADDSFGNMLDRANSPSDPKKPDWANPD